MTNKEECNFARKRKFSTLVLVLLKHVTNVPFICLHYKGDEADLVACHVQYLLNFDTHTEIFRPEKQTIAPKLWFSAHLHLRPTKFYNIGGEYTHFSRDRRSQNNV
jgi:hypothetical protein